jgi:hypothetical protein
MKMIRIRYDDPGRDNAVDITYTAVAPPAMLPNRKHFEQTMKTAGFVRLQGREYQVAGYNVRDRSWGEARREEPVNFPPIVWLTGVFDENFSFNLLLTDNPSRSPDWLGIYDIPEDQALKGGWIYWNGEFNRIVEGSKLTKRDPLTLRPISHDVSVVDQNGRKLHLRGTIEASSPSGFWPNASIHVGLTRWECDGRTGWGDSQECQWTDFVREMHARREGRG